LEFVVFMALALVAQDSPTQDCNEAGFEASRGAKKTELRRERRELHKAAGKTPDGLAQT
jgi:hypothetical protein